MRPSPPWRSASRFLSPTQPRRRTCCASRGPTRYGYNGPAFERLTGDRGATKQVYEALLDIDSNLAIVPQLAVAWKPIEPNTWEFELRQGVSFHDGTPFTAEDVCSASSEREPGRLSSRAPSPTSPPSKRSMIALSASPRRRRIRSFGCGSVSSPSCRRTGRNAAMSRPRPTDYGEEELRLAHRQRYRAIRARGVRARRPLGADPQSRLVGQRGQSDKIDRIVHTWTTMRKRMSRPCSMARSICFRPLCTRGLPDST